MKLFCRVTLVVIAISLLACQDGHRCDQKTAPITAWPADAGKCEPGSK